MPRKTRSSGRRSTSARTRFNEAAARCRGKRQVRHAAGKVLDASMRPRPDAAENFGSALTPEQQAAEASMRPRPDAAENGVVEEEIRRAIKLQ